MERNITLTVVVPVYKVEPYINKCLDSLILPQGLMEKLEVIVVNDGTPDNSAEMAREYEKNYSQVFRVIDKENGGHGSAWNRGLKEASGKYIRFLDSDDWFDKDGLITLMNQLERTDADIVFSPYNRFFSEDRSTVLYPVYNTREDVTIDVTEFDWASQSMNISNFWHSTYRTALLQPLWPLFLEGVHYDDTILYVVPIVEAKTVRLVNSVIYNYLLGRPGQSIESSIVKRHYKAHHLVRMQALDYYLRHADKVGDSGRQQMLARVLGNMLQNDLSDLSFSSFGEKQMMIEWYDRLMEIKQRLPVSDELVRSATRFERIPYPIYFSLRKIKKLFANN